MSCEVGIVVHRILRWPLRLLPLGVHIAYDTSSCPQSEQNPWIWCTSHSRVCFSYVRSHSRLGRNSPWKLCRSYHVVRGSQDWDLSTTFRNWAWTLPIASKQENGDSDTSKEWILPTVNELGREPWASKEITILARSWQFQNDTLFQPGQILSRESG